MSSGILEKALTQPTLAERVKALKIKGGEQSIVSRATQHFNQHNRGRGGEQCLLLDVSGSMGEDCGDGREKIEVLKIIAKEFPRTRQFSFSHRCAETPPDKAFGGTDMTGAFRFIKTHGIRHCVLITDGIPDNPQTALQEAQGLTIDIIYVGPLPEPVFLSQLAAATGGQYGSTSLSKQKEIEHRVQQLLLIEGR